MFGEACPEQSRRAQHDSAIYETISGLIFFSCSSRGKQALSVSAQTKG
jgi:hypothetical protein